MKIAFVVGAFPKLSETFVLQQITGLLELGHDVRIFAFENPAEGIEHPSVAGYGLMARATFLDDFGRRQVLAGVLSAIKRGGIRLSALRYRRALRQRLAHGPQGAFDVVYCHFGHNAERARQLRLAGFFSGPLVAVFHAYEVTMLLRQLGDDFYAPLFRDAARLLPISELWKKKLIALGADPRKIEVRRMGIDCGALAFRPRTLGATETLQVVTVGRLVEKKGVEYAIRAIARAERDLTRPLHYHLIGDGPLRASLERLADQEGVAARVTFHGWKRSDERTALLEGMHLFMAPSVTGHDGDMEGIPVALMEAMAQGLPVLSTEHSGIPELVHDGENGVLVAERDADALARSLTDLAMHPERWTRLCENARREVEARFDATRLARELAELFGSLA